MSLLSSISVIIASGVYLIWFIPYIYHVFHGRVVPHPFSWSVWLLFSVQSGYFVYISQWFSYALIPVVVRTIALCIGSFLWWYYFKKIATRRVDYVALFLALITISVGTILEADKTVILMIIIDFLVLFPTLRKIWVNPKSEDSLAWIMAGFFHLFMILSLREINFENAGYFIYNTWVNFLVAFLIYRRIQYISWMRYYVQKVRNFFALKKKLW